MKRSTVAILALAIVPALAFAQQDTTGARQSSADRNRDQQNQPRLGSQDSTRRGARGQGQTRATARTTAEAGGSVGRGSMRAGGRAGGSYGLSRDQITQLQQALQSAGCDPGQIDGVMGPQTRRAMSCARRQNGVTGNDPNELFRSLNLDFTAQVQMGSENQGRVRPPADSGTEGSAAGAQPPTQAQHGRGMHDSTTSTNRPRPDSSMNRGNSPDSTNRPPR
jgi:putative peptidoglycan binding protein